MKKRKIANIAIVVTAATLFTACQKRENNNTIEETSTTGQVNENDMEGETENSLDITPSADNTTDTETTEEAQDSETTDTESTEKVEQSEIAEINEENNDNSLSPYFLEEPPFAYYCMVSNQAEEVQPLELKEELKESNQITDDEEWFIDNELSCDYYAVSPYYFENIAEQVPDSIPWIQQDLMLTRAFHDESYIYCTYGGDYSQGYLLYIYSLDTQMEVCALDFTNYRYSPEYVAEDYDYIEQAIRWAVLQDNILYVSTNHRTYAQSSNYMNAYITAIDLTDNSILWRTDALVSNSDNFLIMDDVIICGYGFTDEEDYLYQINRYSGEVISRTELKTSPTYFALKDDLLYVRTYDTNYIYMLETQ